MERFLEKYLTLASAMGLEEKTTRLRLGDLENDPVSPTHKKVKRAGKVLSESADSNLSSNKKGTLENIQHQEDACEISAPLWRLSKENLVQCTTRVIQEQKSKLIGGGDETLPTMGQRTKQKLTRPTQLFYGGILLVVLLSVILATLSVMRCRWPTRV